MLKQRKELAFLEVGPGQSLTTLARHAMNGTSFLALSSLPRARSEESAMKTMRESLASLWANGATVNWETLHRGEKRQRISLPTYAFDQQRYWINRSTIALKTTPSHSLLQEEAPQSALAQQSSHVAPRPELSTPYTAPRNATEEAIAKLWANILGLEKIGIHDHFLDCGGHSLLAVQMISRLRDLLHVEVSIGSFFEGPTVAELAQNQGSISATKTPLAPQPRPEQIPLSTGQKRLWFIDQLEGSSAEYNLPEALRLRGPLDVSALARGINDIVDRHEALRTAFVLIDGEPVQRIVPSLVIPLLLEEAGAADDASLLAVVTAALRREWDEPFDLAHGPLLRARLLQLAPEDHILLVTFHHIVSDAWSLGIFNRELAEIYNASLEGRKHSLDPLPLQYADFSLWEQRSVDEEKFARDLGYWRHQLAGLTGRLALPADRSRPAVPTYRADICSVKTDSNCLAALQKLSQKNQATLYMTLLAAFSVLLERYCGQTDFPIATPVSNRPASQLEPLIGFFINSLVMRVKVDLARSFTDLLSEVRRMTLDAYEHQNVPFERLVDELAPERSLSHAPLSQVVFALQNAPGGSPAFSGLSAEPIAGGDLRVRFDLEVHAFESDGTLHLHWVYGRDLFDRWRIEQMAHHFVKLLAELPKNSDIAVHDVSLLSISERGILTSSRGVCGADTV
ncbi:condensation domain-containing protein, partial [Granulicella sp. S190]|uniref:condensation domain-containing protein n=1 Tax=Granulicella sp. S190 TaxID=1747226 RepID=UPI0020B174F1